VGGLHSQGAQPQGERRVMDCIDCHNRAAHTFMTAEEAINRAMADNAINPALPFSIQFVSPRTVRIRLRTGPQVRAEEPSPMLAMLAKYLALAGFWMYSRRL